MPDNTSQPKPAASKNNPNVITQVAERIKDSENVLVALSKNPSVDELSAALGLTFILDKLGKHATAIFSGDVPNAIEFLEPEKTFEANTNSLQDFIIALNKEKADHLRYKVEGDFVKVFITPYKTTLDEKDLEFSHGDFNVDLIIAINVHAENDLDSALAEYGKIKHDASSINISAEAPGKFADLEWGNPNASSVSEMVADLADILSDDSSEEKLVDKSTATALLAGIVAATNRFSNEHTSAETMSIASELMSEGADQQLISSSIPVDILTKGTVDMNDELAEVEKEEPKEEEPKKEKKPAKEKDPTELDIHRDKEEAVVEEQETEEEKTVAKKPDNVPDLPQPEPSPVEPEDETPTAQAEAQEIESTAVPAPADAEPVETPTPELEPLAAPIIPEKPKLPDVEPNVPSSSTVNNEKTLTPPSEEDLPSRELPPIEAPASPEMTPEMPEKALPIVPNDVANAQLPEPITQPPVAEFQPAPTTDPAQPPVPPANADYVAPPLPMPGDGSILPPPPIPFDLDGAPLPPTSQPEPTANPAAAPQVPLAPSNPQDFVQDDDPQQLPAEPIMPAVLQEPDEPTLAPNPGTNQVMQDQVYGDPDAFKIPGM